MAPLAVMEEAPTAEILGAVVSAVTSTLPRVPLVATAVPNGSEATIPVIPTINVPDAVPVAMFKRTVATGPVPMMFWFRPKIRMRTPPAKGLAEALFPAAAAAEPVVTERQLSVEANDKSNCSVLTPVEPGPNETGKSTAEPALPETDPTMTDGEAANVKEHKPASQTRINPRDKNKRFRSGFCLESILLPLYFFIAGKRMTG